MYTSPESVKRYTGLLVEDVGYEEMSDYILKATQKIIGDISVDIKFEEMSGDIDGVNKTFYAQHYPIADVDGDKEISKTVDTILVYDLEVSEWSDRDDETTRTVLEIESVDKSIGKVVLKVAPDIDMEAVTCSYSYLKRDPDWEIIDIAAALLVGYFYGLKEMAFIPDWESKGGLRMVFRHYPWTRFLDEYNRLLDVIIGKRNVLVHPRQFFDIDELKDMQDRADSL